ncbi:MULTISPECIES: hypothetical protein [unclassified Bradyrhizobium]|uniref:hypothetical protein n=1 Tax=unclassified Bradyrhizobium TaxID=2631580 RepID=UPI001CD38395|nr:MULTISPECIES: hypothetical protein [unclassified Bradyrhizobium]
MPVLNALTTQRPLWHSLAQGDWVFAGIDVTCWALALLHVVLAVRTARNRSIVQSKRMPQVPVAIASSGAAE